MKICILQGAFLPIPPRLGGAVEKMWYLLAKKFAEKGHQVIHVSRLWQDLPVKENIDGVLHIRCGGFNTPRHLVVRKILDLIYTLRVSIVIPKDIDVVVTNTFWAPLLLPIFTRAKIYVDVARMPKGQMRFYSLAARLRANSTPVAAAIRSELPENRYGQVAMIPNPLPYEPQMDVDLQSKRKTILYCGRVHPEKGLELLASTAHKIPENWSLVIVGPWDDAAGGGGHVYLQSLKSLFANTPVRFIDPIYDIEELNLQYKEASIFVYPSIAEKGETFGLAPLEAMAWGCVPVVSDLACFKDFIVDGNNGLIFDHRADNADVQLWHCVQRLIDETELREKMASRALDVRISHSADYIADLFLENFEQVIK